MSSVRERTTAVVVGAGPAGIAVAASLRRLGCEPVVLEKGETVAPAWRSHYERLHLHTTRRWSALPRRPMPREYPRYPTRDQVSAYLDAYARDEGVEVRFRSVVKSCRRREGRWEIETAAGSLYETPHLVIATGLSHVPRIPRFAGQDSYAGEVLHSASYRNGVPYAGRRVLVVGFGNSGAEIALDLLEHGAEPHVSVRSPTVVVPRDVLGIPVLTLARFFSMFPPCLGDRLSSPLVKLTVGDVSAVGIPAADWGALEQIARTQKIPTLDVGTMDALRRGEIVAHPDIERFTSDAVTFRDGSSVPFDAVILATGYRPGVDRFLETAADVLDETGRPQVSGDATAEPGLYFCGFWEPPTGRLRRIGVEAERLAAIISTGVATA
jgi:cation diffusion facilitator CzcD-associated flavoprotein CzcO